MKFLGIDYGTQRIGIAISDESGAIAFPHTTLPNDAHTTQKLKELCEKEHIEEIVLGKSQTLKGSDNPVMENIMRLKRALERTIGLPVHFEAEFFTSVEAKRMAQDKNIYDLTRRTTARDTHHERTRDEVSAALILQRYLDKQNA